MKKKISVYNATSAQNESKGIVGLVLMHVLNTLTDISVKECDDPIAADVILGICFGKNCLGIDLIKKLYSEDQAFLLLGMQEKSPEKLPENIKWIYFANYLPEFLEFFQNFIPTENRLKRCIELEPEKKEGALRVLVIDDKSENLSHAIHQLGEDCFLTLAGGYDEGLRMIKKNKYDAVLSDCQMPVGRENSPLGIDAIGISEAVHNGLFLMFPATERGARFAIVTDANHHMDWVSAIFDGLRNAQVNGQPVLFLNNVGKNWGIALERLMSI